MKFTCLAAQEEALVSTHDLSQQASEKPLSAAQESAARRMASAIGTLREPANIVIVGASGGIGSALIRALTGDQRVGSATALSRSGPIIEGTEAGHIDISDEESVAAAAELCAQRGPIDLVIVATGILHDGAALQPDKRMRELSIEKLQRTFLINAFGPALVAKHFLPHLRRNAKAVFAALSARVGSIGDNRLGGWAAYRASKAALNMLIRTLAVEQARSHPEAAVIALHPGTVDTGLSRPFQGRVPADRLFSPEYAAGKLLAVIDKVTSADSGAFFAWDGTRIEY